MLYSPLASPVGVVLLSAKPEEKARLTNVVGQYFTKSKSVLDGYPTYELEAATAGRREHLVVADCGEMANVSAASRTGLLAARFSPNLIVFIGTGGSLRPEKCKVGDVVVPTLGATTKYYDKLNDADWRLWSWEKPQQSADLGGYTKDGRHYRLSRKTKEFPLTGVGRDYVSQALSGAAKAQRLDFDLAKLSAAGADPEVHVDAQVFSWDMVLASDHYRKLLLDQIDRKVSVVDMESFGFLSALTQFQIPPVNKLISSVIVRGISDICGNKDTSSADGRNNIATDNAAHVACRIVKHGYLEL